jgi:hypothetical protein
MTELTISYYLERFITDASFAEQLETQIESILSDGVISVKEIPTVILIVVELIENHSTIIIKNNDLASGIIKNIILVLVKKYHKTITETDLKLINEIIESSLKLLFIVPIFKKRTCC